ncbi:MAG: hypothetical protein JW395_3945 [Nitrospira sp.]|nr:hypothetical protein [Nitrospira sp.]
MSNVDVQPSDEGLGAATDMSLPGYQQLVRDLLARGYELVDFEQAKPERKHLILRHDVDMCLERAVAMAAVETSIGIRSHYFVLLDTEMYNLASHRSREAMRSILQGGHQIGLHFDASRIGDGNIEALQSEVRRECHILEQHTGRPVKVVTFHRPGKWALGFPEPLAGRLHGYQPRFFSEMGYCTDSEGRFRFHHPLSHPAVQEGRALQLVIHPIWWAAQSSQSALAKLETFLGDRQVLLADELAINCRPFAARHLNGRSP